MRVRSRINVNNLKENLDKITSNIGKDKLMAILKANAYGHGFEGIFLKCLDYGIKFFGVASKDEALKLRKINKEVDILILGPVEFEDIEVLVNNDISLTISSFDEIDYIIKNNIKGNFHIAFDSGMGRLGFNIDDIEKAIKLLNPIGLFSHLSSADSDREYTLFQKKLFDEVAIKFDFKYIHLLNSFGTEYYSEEFIPYSLYRVGILIYGAELVEKYKPVMTFEARVSYIKKLDRDWNIGYSNTYKAKKGDIIATISAGYADGIFRALSNKGKVYLKGKLYNIVGNICMDQFMILADEDVKVGDYVEIFGENILVKDVAIQLGTISYELLCAVSSRVDRVYEEDKI